jgi:hypothetical protein
MTKTNTDESLFAWLRLLLDEIVEGLSRNGAGSSSAPRCDAARTDKRRICNSGKTRMAMSAAIAHITTTLLGVIDASVFHLGLSRRGSFVHEGRLSDQTERALVTPMRRAPASSSESWNVRDSRDCTDWGHDHIEQSEPKIQGTIRGVLNASVSMVWRKRLMVGSTHEPAWGLRPAGFASAFSVSTLQTCH